MVVWSGHPTPSTTSRSGKMVTPHRGSGEMWTKSISSRFSGAETNVCETCCPRYLRNLGLTVQLPNVLETSRPCPTYETYKRIDVAETRSDLIGSASNECMRNVLPVVLLRPRAQRPTCTHECARRPVCTLHVRTPTCVLHLHTSVPTWTHECVCRPSV